MTIGEWVSLFAEQFRETGVLQWIAVSFGVAEVLLARANKVLLYPAGIIATVLSAFLLYEAGLFAEAGLNLYYFVMSIYGWAHWVRRKNQAPVAVSGADQSDWLITFLISIGGCGVLYLVLRYFTSSDVPFRDAVVTSTAWAGMWLLAKRKVENWILLNISNALAVPLLIHKKMPLFAALTVFLFIVACFGFVEWKKILRTQKAAVRA